MLAAEVGLGLGSREQLSLDAVMEKGRTPAARETERVAERAEGRATLKHRAIEAMVSEVDESRRD